VRREKVNRKPRSTNDTNFHELISSNVKAINKQGKASESDCSSSSFILVFSSDVRMNEGRDETELLLYLDLPCEENQLSPESPLLGSEGKGPFEWFCLTNRL